LGKTKEPTFKSLKVLDAENPTEMGKNVDGSAAGTANSIEPLEMKGKQALATVCVHVLRGWGDGS